MQRRASAALATAVVGICGLLWQAVPASQESGWQVTDVDVGPALEVDIAVDARSDAVAVWVKQQRVVGASVPGRSRPGR